MNQELISDLVAANLTIAAVVATHNRPRHLANRALASIAAQTRLPDILVVVDDSDPKHRETNEEIVADFTTSGTQVVYLGNYRTPGASGAWNTALAWLQSRAPASFVAILDDDDAWSADYLEKCESQALDGGFDMIVAGLLYHTSTNEEGVRLSIPNTLRADEFLSSNPHIQGSNLFVRLQTLLEAGGFDEALPSTTDRDLCIRLADLGCARYGVVHEHLVHHYAEPGGRPRLSSPGSEAKREGLTRFYQKYRGRMNGERREAFLERCRTLFDCDPSIESTPIESGHLPHLEVTDDNFEGELSLLVGFITSPETEKTERLLDDLSMNLGERPDIGLRVLLLENGGANESERARLGTVVRKASAKLEVTLIGLEQQKRDVEARAFAVQLDILPDRKSIALSRTMLQHYLYLEAKAQPGTVVWILDDDCRLDALTHDSNGRLQKTAIDIALHLKRLKGMDYGVVLGSVTGEPPLPFSSCVRVQLVDLYHNLNWMAAMSPDESLPNSARENSGLRGTHRDYYYDLSRRETDHLESPFWYSPQNGSATVGEAFIEMVERLQDIMRGVQVFRPLVYEQGGDPLSYIVPSVNRGPSTFVFDMNALRDFPNAVPAIDGADTRRSDMVWSLLNRFVGGRKIVSVPLPVRQDRSLVEQGTLDFDKLIQDIRGYALYSCMHDVFLNKVQQRQLEGRLPYGPSLLHFDQQDIDFAIDRFQKYLRERLIAFEMSFIRIRGLLKSFDRLLDPTSDQWWLKDECYQEAVEQLASFVRMMETIYSGLDLDDFRNQVESVDLKQVTDYLKRLQSLVDAYRSSISLPVEQLIETAERFVRREFHVDGLRCLGVGEEGVVLTDGRLVYKYFHYWKSRDRERQVSFLQDQVDRWQGFKTLSPIMELRRVGDVVVIVYPYVEGSKYDGGHLDDILTFLGECRQAGIVCRNVHPDNFIVTSEGLKLIDYGSDIRPYNNEDFLYMCRRAFLMYRFHFRSDLRRLMRQSLEEFDLPELSGFQHFMRALEPRSKEEILDPLLVEIVLASEPNTVLDYGCGNGKIAEALASHGVRIHGYDIDEEVIELCRSYQSDVKYMNSSQLSTKLEASIKYDVVVCSLVLCTLKDSNELGKVLNHMRRLVSDSGEVIVAVCNPFHTFVERSELQHRVLPESVSYNETFVYNKQITSTTTTRVDVHRPHDTYRKAFLNAGFFIEETQETDGADTLNLRPSSEFLVFRLRPVPVKGPKVSLLIKTCFMEWRIIERFVRHQVEQLESPAMFFENVIAVDPRTDGFARQYDEPNAEAHREAMQRLLDDGIVDRVVYAPQDDEAMVKTYRRWFGIDASHTHSANGQQLFATLHGFESCQGDYVLQIDSDLLIHRGDWNHDYLAEMIDILEHDPSALFVSLPIYQDSRRPFTSQGPNGDWRVEVRACLFDKSRIQAVLPIPNEIEKGRFNLGWHRAFDRFIGIMDYRSYRGGNPATCFIHVPNDPKGDVEQLFCIMDRVEQGYLPDVQLGKVELRGKWQDWAGPKRTEPFIFVICGRNVDPGCIKRCLDSVASQTLSCWGAVIVDDASENGVGDYIKTLVSPYRDRVTFLRNHSRRGLLHNTWEAITHFCSNPESVVITLDADDALIGPHVLERVKREYDAGADVTVGSMLRLDKEATYVPDFDDPRGKRGGNVWQHLRTFKKYLFDAIRVEDLRIGGEWIELANDWAFMLPIIEMARHPAYIPEFLYMYEPSKQKLAGNYNEERERVIAEIIRKPRYYHSDLMP